MEEEVDFILEKDNPFNLFGIKVIKKTKGETVKRLSVEHLGVTNYLIDRGTRFTVVLTSSHDCVSPLFQGAR